MRVTYDYLFPRPWPLPPLSITTIFLPHLLLHLHLKIITKTKLLYFYLKNKAASQWFERARANCRSVLIWLFRAGYRWFITKHLVLGERLTTWTGIKIVSSFLSSNTVWHPLRRRPNFEGLFNNVIWGYFVCIRSQGESVITAGLPVIKQNLIIYHSVDK